jgi:hypothetical protein
LERCAAIVSPMLPTLMSDKASSNPEQESPIKPFPDSKFVLTTPSSVITADRGAALLMVRLGLAANALVSQHRFAVSLKDSDGAAAARDRISALVVAASVTHEAIVVSKEQYKYVTELAKAGGLDAEKLEQFGQLAGGKHQVSALLTKVRNQIGFHWDADVMGKALDQFAVHPEVVWAEGREATTGETIYRLSADVVMEAMFPEPEEQKELSADERRDKLRARTGEEMAKLALVMILIVELIDTAMTEYFNRAGNVRVVGL